MSPRAKKPVPPPAVFVIDTREQTPFALWDLDDWRGEKIGKDRVIRGTLKTGDYSVRGFESAAAVERKSFDDLFGSLTYGRDRLLDEIERARELKFFGFVIEAPLWKISQGHSRMGRFTGDDAVRSILSWQVRYPWVHWHWCDNRTEASLVTVRLLERFAMVFPEMAATTPEEIALPV